MKNPNFLKKLIVGFKIFFIISKMFLLSFYKLLKTKLTFLTYDGNKSAEYIDIQIGHSKIKASEKTYKEKNQLIKFLIATDRYICEYLSYFNLSAICLSISYSTKINQ